ncbi:MAG TPA: hypothetical protein VFA84_08025 [Acidimicrobiales bacterium]|nr:hypothetical protein [Acidimicrobiales bacterium]
MDPEFWHSDDDFAVLARYLAEHTYEAGMSDGMFVIEVGDADLLPEFEPARERSVCARCGTAIELLSDAGWRHLEGLHARGSCTTIWPR